jgi:Fe-S cluster assembly protein SufD
METATPVNTSAFKEALQDQPSALSAHHGQQVNDARSLAAITPFPTTKSEAWKYTRTGRITNQPWHVTPRPATNVRIEDPLEGLVTSGKIVFINGQLSSAQLTEEAAACLRIDTEGNLPVRLLPQLHGDAFNEMHTGWCTSVIQLHIREGAQLQHPVHLIHRITGKEVWAQPLVVIYAGAGSNAAFVESFLSTSTDDHSFTHRRLWAELAENAQLHLDKIQGETGENFLLNREQVSLQRDARFHINTLSLNGNWIRNELSISLEGPNAHAGLNGLFLPVQQQTVDNHTRVDHKAAHCESRELYKGMLRDQSTGVFNGKVFVHPDAQKTNAYQSNANILLSDEAQMYTKPELEIYADDVKCSHGTTTGQLDEAAVFYLKARGIGEENARRLLTNAFLSDVLEEVKHAAVRDFVLRDLSQRGLLYNE